MPAMKIEEEIDIPASPSDVWPFVAIPSRLAEWNSKITAVERKSERPVFLGERFTMTFTMSGRSRSPVVEVTACEPASRLVLRYEMAAGEHAEETFTLSSSGSMTHVQHLITFTSAGIPWILKPIVWLLLRFGRPVEESYLSRLRQCVESSLRSNG